MHKRLVNQKNSPTGTFTEIGLNFFTGVGEFLSRKEADNYGFSKPDNQDSPVRAESMELDFGVQLKWEGDTESGVKDL
ncbi:hypothetical protein [Nostoc sp. CHAB 5715]|uniref:hypothetical protein n=1 Tax=Nostoc sp. CHAB 5715 TaxID=2780400 RepID=UPI001E58F8DB|nr:hypothetical protein [Nostoc sp. CHAB 5715]MCC5621415.1 hypothetical protein [Nostoc sp. CHAB 5715]